MSSVWEGSKTEAFVQGVALGAEREQRRIIHLLEARRDDLASCLKDDDCLLRADAIDVVLCDIKGVDE